MTVFCLNSVEQMSMASSAISRRIVKALINKWDGYQGEHLTDPCMKDIEELLYPPMKDETHLLDGRTLEETWPERKAKILALPDRPPEDLFLEQLKIDKADWEDRQERKRTFHQRHPNWFPEIDWG